jgi:hypothetical protein
VVVSDFEIRDSSFSLYQLSVADVGVFIGDGVMGFSELVLISPTAKREPKNIEQGISNHEVRFEFWLTMFTLFAKIEINQTNTETSVASPE